MGNRILKQIYSLSYNEDFSYADFSKRLKMQKGIYLLQEMGVPVGNYRFSWYKHGPYSQSLLDDMRVYSSTENVRLSSDATTAITELGNALEVPNDTEYTDADWAECMSCLHYLKETFLHFNASDAEILAELDRKNPQLSDDNANNVAINRLKIMFK